MNKGVFFLVALTVVSVAYYFIGYYETNDSEFQMEYEVELVNQNTVKIRTLEGKIYTVDFDNMQEAFLLDNL